MFALCETEVEFVCNSCKLWSQNLWSNFPSSGHTSVNHTRGFC